ncbi:MFS general substrate transporter [Myriangium duriaei CBS 260.36]|uniref:MFS general substrate transporter n=1 Tax=Myriangium duriaei CBS 260.36 TaxID=1168546 RepID=A0A9P4MFB9_9PEZI|nr:MFS general substrate transporter [Myriangium duriaei CBS 260.36]
MFRVVHNETTNCTTFSEDVVLDPVPTSSPNDPLNWSSPRKYWHAFLALFYTCFTAATANDAGAASDELLNELNIDYNVQNTAAGVLFLGIGYWTLVSSPTPVLYGRRLQYFICLIFSVIGSIWFARQRHVRDAIWNQLFVGASEACAEALVQQSLSDLFFQHQRGTVFGMYVLATSIGTFLGPLVGGYIASWAWPWVGWWAAIISVGTLVIFYLGFEETSFHRDALLGRQRSRGSATVISPGEMTQEEHDQDVKTDVPYRTHSLNAGPDELHDPPTTYRQRIALITPAPNLLGWGLKQYMERLYHTLRVFMFPVVLYSGLQWGAQDAWLSFYLTIEEDNWYGPPWNYSDAAVAIMNIPTLIGALIGCVYGGWLSDYFVQWMAKRRGGLSEAEDRLWLSIPSAIIGPAGLLLFGIGSSQGMTWPGPYIGLGMIGFGWGCAGDLSLAYLADCYPDIILEGMVCVAVINNTMASIFTFVISDWIVASGMQSTSIAIGVLSCGFQLVVVVMLIWGKTFRRQTAKRYMRFVCIRDGR